MLERGGAVSTAFLLVSFFHIGLLIGGNSTVDIWRHPHALRDQQGRETVPAEFFYRPIWLKWIHLIEPRKPGRHLTSFTAFATSASILRPPPPRTLSESKRIQNHDCGVQQPFCPSGLWRLVSHEAGSSFAGTKDKKSALLDDVRLIRLWEVYVR